MQIFEKETNYFYACVGCVELLINFYSYIFFSLELLYFYNRLNVLLECV